MKRDHLVPLLYIGIAAIVLLALAGLFFFLRLPDAAQQLPPGSNRLIVNLTSPANGDRLDPAATTTIQADALGVRPVAAMQLWVDGALLGSKQATASGHQQVSTFWA